jgi:hypothetical protein
MDSGGLNMIFFHICHLGCPVQHTDRGNLSTQDEALESLEQWSRLAQGCWSPWNGPGRAMAHLFWGLRRHWRRVPLWQNHLGEGFVARINLSDSWRSENIINTHKYNTIYWSSSRNNYILSSRINYTEKVWSQNHASNDKLEFVKAISLNGQNILFALKENIIHQHSKPEDPSMESNPHRFRLPTDNPRRHRRQEETVPHLHTKDSNTKVWVTTLSMTYPRWPKDHL